MRAERRGSRWGLAILAMAALTLSGCTRIEDAMASVPFLNFMREAPFFDPYEAPRPAPPNSVPLESPAGDWEPTIPTPVTEAALLAFAAETSNPLPMDSAVLARGAFVFETYCSVCHGDRGQGNGPIVGQGKFPMGPALTIPTTVGRSDGYIYAIVKAGRGLMPAYRRIPPTDRWAVVNYVRQLQRQSGAQPAQGQMAPGQTTPGNGTAGGAGAGATGAAGTGGLE